MEQTLFSKLPKDVRGVLSNYNSYSRYLTSKFSNQKSREVISTSHRKDFELLNEVFKNKGLKSRFLFSDTPHSVSKWIVLNIDPNDIFTLDIFKIIMLTWFKYIFEASNNEEEKYIRESFVTSYNKKFREYNIPLQLIGNFVGKYSDDEETIILVEYVDYIPIY